MWSKLAGALFEALVGGILGELEARRRETALRDLGYGKAIDNARKQETEARLRMAAIRSAGPGGTAGRLRDAAF